MTTCFECKKHPAAEIIKICARCLKEKAGTDDLLALHSQIRQNYHLALQPPEDIDGIPCTNCSHGCRLLEAQTGYCGVRKNSKGTIVSVAQPSGALASYYLDPLPTNCCASWFCKGSSEKGYNLAVFFYGCNFNCLFCQNSSHKQTASAPSVTLQELLEAALNPAVRCVCFFGGSPEPQLEFALEFSEMLLEQSKNSKHICWEWNGCGNPQLVRQAARLSALSGGTVKFDLKAFSKNTALALCGVDNTRSFKNFAMISADYKEQNILTATTLLVPYYVDEDEVENMAQFIAQQSTDIPYSLLVFHPDFLMKDLPITPRAQVDACFKKASQYLENVNIGNRHLL
jgi:pyruvate formate lyase activating enzyme